jgi:hypothetical protein
MKIASIQSMALRILAFATAALFSTVALAMSLTWEFSGQSTDQTPFSATMTFDAFQQPSEVISSTIVVGGTNGGAITETVPVLTEYFAFTELSFELGSGSVLIAQGTTGDGSIIQTDVLGTSGVFTDTYSIEAIFSSNAFTQTLTIDISGPDLFNSLLTDINKLQSNLPGAFLAFGNPGEITGVSELTAIPEPWTLGLVLSGLGSIGFLSFAALRSRRAR